MAEVKNSEDCPIQKATIKICRSDAVLLGIAGLSVAALYAFAVPSMVGGPTADSANQARHNQAEDLLAETPKSDQAAYALGAKRLNATAVQVGPVARLRKIYDHIGYDLKQVRDGADVPRVILSALPGDINQVKQPVERKNLFIKSTMPLILLVNEWVTLDRARVLQLQRKHAAGQSLTEIEQNWLHRTQEDYNLPKVDFDLKEDPDFKALLTRVDIVPPSLTLAQSAEESGWGTSRFAREGNALFGQRTWRGSRGIVPKQRAEGEKFRVRAFGSLIDGVRAYVRNLNSHPAYGNFRKLRAEARANGDPLKPAPLIDTLIRYSERGADYLKTIKVILRVNKLHRFDKTRLGDPIDLPTPSSGA